MSNTERIDEEHWSDILSTDNCNHAAELFTQKFINICDRHAPVRTIMMKDHAPAWITNDYLAHHDEQKFHCHNFNRHPRPENKLLKEEAIQRCNAL